MKKSLRNLSVAISIIATTALFTGCGGSSSSKDNITTTSQESFSPTKVDREWYHGVNSDDSNSNISFEIDNSSIKISISDISAGDFRHNQFFINTDNNANSGYETVGGADYLIEDSHIYKSTGRGWSWNYVGEVKNIQISDDLNSVELTLNSGTFDQLTKQISIISFQVDANWHPIKATKKSIELDDNIQNNRLTREEAIHIVSRVESDLNNDDNIGAAYVHSEIDFDSIRVIDNDTISYVIKERNVGPNQGIAPLASYARRYIYKISEDSKQVQEVVKTYDSISLTENQITMNFGMTRFDHYQIFVNSDANTQTGYGRYGADFLIEDGHLYRFTGRGWSWEWEYIKELDQNKKGNSVTINFQKGDLGELRSSNFDNVVEYNVIIKDKNWNEIADYYNGLVYQR